MRHAGIFFRDKIKPVLLIQLNLLKWERDLPLELTLIGHKDRWGNEKTVTPVPAPQRAAPLPPKAKLWPPLMCPRHSILGSLLLSVLL